MHPVAEEGAVSLIKWNAVDGRVSLGLPTDLDLAMTQPVIDSLKHAFATSNAVMVEADGVERVSAACVQALVVASRSATERGRTFLISRPSEALAEACEDLGLADWLKQWSAS